MIKLIAAADLHIHDRKPENRTGDYFRQVLNKFEQIVKITHQEKASLLIAGDFFDSPSVSYNVVRSILAIIKKYKVPIYTISGQHDQRYHVSGLSNTPLGLLYETGYVNDLTLPINAEKGFIGASWGEEPKSEADVLVLHRMVTKDGPLWHGQENFISAKELLKQYPWAKVVITGDNHLPHLVNYLGRYQLNCGSMMRSSKDQIDHKPAVYQIKIIDDGDFTNKPRIVIDEIPLVIEPASRVFDLNKIQKENIQKELTEDAQKKIENFINTLPVTEDEKPNFKTSLHTVMESIKPSEKVKSIVNSIMEKCTKGEK